MNNMSKTETKTIKKQQYQNTSSTTTTTTINEQEMNTTRTTTAITTTENDRKSTTTKQQQPTTRNQQQQNNANQEEEIKHKNNKMNPQPQQIKNNQNIQTWNLNEEKQPRRDWQRTMTRESRWKKERGEKKRKRRRRRRKRRRRRTREQENKNNNNKKTKNPQQSKEEGMKEGQGERKGTTGRILKTSLLAEKKGKNRLKLQEKWRVGGYPKPNNHHLWSSLGHLMSLDFFFLSLLSLSGWNPDNEKSLRLHIFLFLCRFKPSFRAPEGNLVAPFSA